MHEVDFFVRIGTARFPGLDIWEVTLEEEGSSVAREFDGFLCWMQAIPPARLRLVTRDITAPHDPSGSDTQSANDAYIGFVERRSLS
jgi:hypothetical protein